jgi:hypothetical protein
VRFWRNRDLSVIVGNGCFQPVAKLTSTANMRAQRRRSVMKSKMSASLIGHLGQALF